MITNRIVENYLICKRKALLAANGKQGTHHEYEVLTEELQKEQRPLAKMALLRHFGVDPPLKSPILTTETLKLGAAVILDCSLVDDHFQFHFDAVFRHKGRSSLGKFHYAPVMFIPDSSVRDEHKLILALEAILLGRIQVTEPERGLYVLGATAKIIRAQLDTRHERAKKLLADVEQAVAGAMDERPRLNRHCDVCEFQERCRTEAQQKDDLTLLRGISDAEIQKMNSKGIFTVTQLSYTFHPQRNRKSSKSPKRKRQFPLQALAIREKKVFFLDSPSLPNAPVHVYLDFEGDPARKHPYLAGAIIAKGAERNFFSFWSDTDRAWEDVVSPLVAEIRSFQEYIVFHYGSYEHDCLTAARNPANAQEIDGILAHSCNVLSVIYNHVYFPTYSNGLKEIGSYLGCSWPPPISSGSQTPYWRHRWEITHDEDCKNGLVAYNQHDCVALERVVQFLLGAVASQQTGQPDARLAYIDDRALKSHWNYRSPLFPDFEHINKCAYFDYQRDHVFVRHDKRLRRQRAKHRRAKKLRIRPNRELEIAITECPECGGHRFAKRERRKIKWAFDLIISAAGVRRHVTKLTAAKHVCQKCGLICVPEQYDRLDKHGHALKSWSMYQHIVHCTSTHRLEEMVRDIFGLPLHGSDFLDMKHVLALYYRDTCSEILATLKAGPLIHIDETPVRVKTGKGYVWVLASVQEVLYMYRPNREGGFLPDLLGGFGGVLVSDFYGAYDSLPCLQQKCLVHFIRDINSDLIRNPFDSEFKEFVSQFSGLMRSVVATIDTVGLKRRMFGKHRRAAEKFLRTIVEGHFSSATMEAYRKRLEHYGERMFTFLDHDGVPWNNAHAEHAIRTFANYRNKADGYLTVAGLEDHLALLSVSQSCAYRGIRFLDFLLSQERSLAQFSEQKKRKRLPPTINVYPEGFFPFHQRLKDSHRRLGRKFDHRIRIGYLKKSGRAIPEIMEELGVSGRSVALALSRGQRKQRRSKIST